MQNAHEIDFKIFGEEMQFVEIELDQGETVIAEPGSMLMMDEDIDMQTIFGDGSEQDQGFMCGSRYQCGYRIFEKTGTWFFWWGRIYHAETGR